MSPHELQYCKPDSRSPGFRISIGSTLPRCVRVRSPVVKTVDGVAEGEVRSDSQEKVPFHQRDDGFLGSGRVKHAVETLLGSAGRPLCPSRVSKRSKWQDRGIIPAMYSNPSKAMPYQGRPGVPGWLRWHPERSGHGARIRSNLPSSPFQSTRAHDPDRPSGLRHPAWAHQSRLEHARVKT